MNPEGVERRKRPSSDDLFELMSVLAHDLRAPLTPMKGYGEILRTRANLGQEKTTAYATIVVEAAARMERSVDLLSGISALYGGRAEMRTERLRPVDLVTERLDLWRGRVPDRTFGGQTVAAYGAVVADRGWLGKALDVLIDQALRSAPAPASVVLEARTNPGGESTSFMVCISGDADCPEEIKSDRLARAFLISVSDVCGYPMGDDLVIEVPASPEP